MLHHGLPGDRQPFGQRGRGGLAPGSQILQQPPPGRVGHRAENLVRPGCHPGHRPALTRPPALARPPGLARPPALARRPEPEIGG
jgi:hypothetical protein